MNTDLLKDPFYQKIYVSAQENALKFLEQLQETEDMQGAIVDFIALTSVTCYELGVNSRARKSNVKRFDFADMHAEPKDLV